MPKHEILTAQQFGQRFAVHLADGRLQNLYIDAVDSDTQRWGNICLGQVTRLDPHSQQAWIDLGLGRSGLLTASHSRRNITEELKEGARIPVQIRSVEKTHSVPHLAKQAKLTMDIALPGRFLVHTPMSGDVTISRRVEKKELLNLAARLDKHEGGWIIRANALNAPLEDVMAEANGLSKRWFDIKDKLSNARTAGLIETGPDARTRLFNDIPDLKNCTIEDAEDDSLFELRDVNTQIATLTQPHIALSNGASLVVESTQALISIDVNSGNQTDRLKLNLEAAEAAAAQIRLRNLSGVILVDLINMPHKPDREQLTERLQQVLAQDPGRPRLHGLTQTGMAEITRPRGSASLNEVLSPAFLEVF